MHMKKLLASILATATLPLAAGAQAACQDDERLYAISDFLVAQQNGNPAPLELTAATYLNLTPKAREAIGDNLVIFDASCNAMQVLEGEPPVRIEMPFPVLYSAYYDAVLRGDKKSAKILLHSFKAKGMESEEFLSLIALVSRDEGLSNQLASNAGMELHESVGRKCKEPVGYLTYADLFVRFGGLVEGEHGRAWYASGSDEKIISVDNKFETSYGWMPGSCLMSKQATLSAIRGAGGIVIDIGNDLTDMWKYEKKSEPVLKAYNAWVAAGAPDEGPQSLFE